MNAVFLGVFVATAVYVVTNTTVFLHAHL